MRAVRVSLEWIVFCGKVLMVLSFWFWGEG